MNEKVIAPKALYIFGTYRDWTNFHADLTAKDNNGYGLHSWNYIPELIQTLSVPLPGQRIGAVFFLRPVINGGQ